MECEKHPQPFSGPAKQKQIHEQRFCNKVTLTLFFAVREHKYFAIVSVTIDLCQRKIACLNAPLVNYYGIDRGADS